MPRIDRDQPAPHVVIVGGYLTEPLFYRPMRARLLERGAASVAVTAIHVPDWIAAAFVGFGPLLLRGARAIIEARRESEAPLIVVGHSAGGIVTRLAMSPRRFDGRGVGVADAVGCLVMLGTPHLVRPHDAWRGNAGQRAIRFLARETPGAWFAPRTRYLTVGSIAVPPRGPDRAPPPKQLLNRILTAFVGPSDDVGGDGIVTDDLTRLEGARHITLPDALHGTYGGPWYGDGHVIDRWWPAAIEEWRAALESRRDAIHEPPEPPTVEPPGRESPNDEPLGRRSPSDGPPRRDPSRPMAAADPVLGSGARG